MHKSYHQFCTELPALFTQEYSKHFNFISEVKNAMLLEDAYKRLMTSCLLAQKYNRGYDVEILNLLLQWSVIVSN